MDEDFKGLGPSRGEKRTCLLLKAEDCTQSCACLSKGFGDRATGSWRLGIVDHDRKLCW